MAKAEATIEELVSKIECGELRLPEMQHRYVWRSTRVRDLLDYLETEEDIQLPDELQERIHSGELFFWDAGETLHFQSQLLVYCAITGRRKLPWRYRWADAAGLMPCGMMCLPGC